MPEAQVAPAAGEPLERIMRGPMELGLALRIAVRLASALGEIHRSGIVHGDIKPQTILFDARSGEVSFTGFRISVTTTGEHWASGGRIEGTLPYMSPEQTGRLSRPIDARSDLYSVGVTLYEMLAGARPFEALDAVGWIHCHLARTPKRLVRRLVPAPVSEIVLKLLK